MVLYVQADNFLPKTFGLTSPALWMANPLFLSAYCNICGCPFINDEIKNAQDVHFILLIFGSPAFQHFPPSRNLEVPHQTQDYQHF